MDENSNKKTATPKVLITGASGFIGSFLVNEALNRGYHVWAGVRKGSNLSRLQDERIHFIHLEYADKERLVKQLSDFAQTVGRWDFVVHNAGVTKVLKVDDFHRVNYLHTRNLIDALIAADCRPRKFLLMSSLSSYGLGDEKTFRPISLDDPQSPNTMYGKSKKEAEDYIRSQQAFPYVILRPTGVYGPNDKDYYLEIKSIRSGFDFAVGFTPQRITFIYVKDLARVVFLSLENASIINRHYFVADGDVYTDKEFAGLIQEILSNKHVFHARIPTFLVRIACLCSEVIGKMIGKSMTLNSDKYRILKQRNWICDVTPLQEELAFTPEYSLRKGLEETIAWYRREGWL